jgi:hypothetical protein
MLPSAHEEAAVWIARELARDKPHRVNHARLRLIGPLGLVFLPTGNIRPRVDREAVDSGYARWSCPCGRGALANDRCPHVSLGRRPIAEMWLQAAQVAGYDFVLLASIAALSEEAKAMRNCLNTYGYNLAHNRSRLWSVRRNGEWIATLRIACRYRDPLLNIVELKPAGNADVPRELWWGARQWLHMHNLLQVNTGKQPYWGTAPLDRATWLSLRRPYWLAKRRIPDGCRSAGRATRSTSYDGCHFRQCAAMSARRASHTLGWLASQSRAFASPKARPGCAMMRL